MTFFARGWFDRFLRRGKETRAEGAAVRARTRREEQEDRVPGSTADVEEGASAARDEAIARHEPMQPPGTG